jgi:hypothetical protein
MMNVVGIGKAGCRIAGLLNEYPQYDVYKIDVGLKKTDRVFPITKRSSPSEYEEKFSKRIFSDLKKIKGNVLLIVGGGGSISSCTLRVMEALRHNETELVYVKPDPSFLTEVGITLDKIVFNVLQEYARSGLLEKLYIVSNGEIEKVVGQIPVSRYYQKINEIIASTLHMINVYKNSSPSLSNIKEISGISRISTIGIGTFEKIRDQMFYPIDYVGEKVYYFAINKKQLDQDEELLPKIKIRIKQEDSTIRTSFGVYPTPYDENYIYILANTKIIQGVNYDE